MAVDAAVRAVHFSREYGESIPLSDSPPWSQTICEWIGCAGVGLVPALLNFITAALVERSRPVLLSKEVLISEALLWCLVTVVATIVIFISKYNVVAEIAERIGVPRIPTSMVFLSFPLLISILVIEIAHRIRVLAGDE